LCHALSCICEKVTIESGTRLFDRIESFLAAIPKNVMGEFLEFQNKTTPGHKGLAFVRHVPTRWFSKFAMAERYIQLSGAVASYLRFELTKSNSELAESLESRMLKGNEVRDLEAVLDVLRPFKEVLTKAESDSTPTLCNVPQWISDLRDHVKDDVTHDPLLVQTWKSKLRAACADLFHLVFETPSLPLRAACFHPIYGTLPWVSAEVRNLVWEKVVEDIVAIQPPPPLEDSSELQLLKETTEQDVRIAVGNLRKLFENNHERFVAKYSQGEPGQLSPIQDFWENYKDKPRNALLFDAACFYMSIQASSTASERLWSTTTDLTNRRPQLCSHNLETLAVLRGCLKMAKSDDQLFEALLKQQ